jgi:hypothetical protein
MTFPRSSVYAAKPQRASRKQLKGALGSAAIGSLPLERRRIRAAARIRLLMSRRISAICFLGYFVSGCVVGPDYQRPDVSAPPVYRGADTALSAAATESFGDLAWWSIFQDPDLQALIRAALEQNYDLRIAASRIMALTPRTRR